MTIGKTKIPISYIALIISNLFSIYLAVAQQWSIGEMAWIYLFQSIIIGIFNFLKIRSLKTFRTDGLTSNGKAVIPNSAEDRDGVAFFFLMHYGFFHLVFGLLLLHQKEALQRLLSDPFFLVIIGIIIINHFFSFISNYKNDINRNVNIGTLMFFPYARIAPMLGALFLSEMAGAKYLIYFMILKMVADLIMHAIEHSMALPQLVKPELEKEKIK